VRLRDVESEGLRDIALTCTSISVRILYKCYTMQFPFPFANETINMSAKQDSKKVASSLLQSRVVQELCEY
jgi:hypothetical protein